MSSTLLPDISTGYPSPFEENVCSIQNMRFRGASVSQYRHTVTTIAAAARNDRTRTTSRTLEERFFFRFVRAGTSDAASSTDDSALAVALRLGRGGLRLADVSHAMGDGSPSEVIFRLFIFKSRLSAMAVTSFSSLCYPVRSLPALRLFVFIKHLFQIQAAGGSGFSGTRTVTRF